MRPVVSSDWNGLGMTFPIIGENGANVFQALDACRAIIPLCLCCDVMGCGRYGANVASPTGIEPVFSG